MTGSQPDGGGYSQLEKDFLGIERLVHYNAAGEQIGVSEVVTDEAGRTRYVLMEGQTPTGESASATAAPTSTTSIKESLEPTEDGGFAGLISRHPWAFGAAAFVVAALGTYLFLSQRSSGYYETGREVSRTVERRSESNPYTRSGPDPSTQIPVTPPPSVPDSAPSNAPLAEPVNPPSVGPDPAAPADVPPTDLPGERTEPGDTRPRVEPKPTEPPATDPEEQVNAPIDLRGDGSIAEPPKSSEKKKGE